MKRSLSSVICESSPVTPDVYAQRPLTLRQRRLASTENLPVWTHRMLSSTSNRRKRSLIVAGQTNYVARLECNHDGEISSFRVVHTVFNNAVFCYIHRSEIRICATIYRYRHTKSILSILHFVGRPYYRSSLWHDVSSVVCLSVCLSSVTFCIVAKRYVLAKNCLKE